VRKQHRETCAQTTNRRAPRLPVPEAGQPRQQPSPREVEGVHGLQQAPLVRNDVQDPAAGHMRLHTPGTGLGQLLVTCVCKMHSPGAALVRAPVVGPQRRRQSPLQENS
jgi:hypothetical protein